MKRRNFLKLVAAAVVCPKVLLEAEPTTKKFAVFHANGGNLTDKEREELIKKMRRAMKNTKFKKPMHLKCVYLYGIPYYFQGVPCYYQSKLDG